MIPCAVIQAARGGVDQIHADPQYCCEGRHRIEAAVEPEDELIEVGRQMFLADPMVGLFSQVFKFENAMWIIRKWASIFAPSQPCTLGSCAYPNLVNSS
jgi:hypothetical protein